MAAVRSDPADFLSTYPETPALRNRRTYSRSSYCDSTRILRPRAQLADFQRRLEPAEARHRDVHHGDVGLEGLRPCDGLAAVRGLADHLHVVGHVDQGLHALADDGVVVGDENADLRHARPPGERER